MTTLSATGQESLTGHRRTLLPLTGIRFFAAAYVVVFHTTLGAMLVKKHHQFLGYLLGNGFLAVALFFLLSGFILSYTYFGQIETNSQRRRFWEARFARIWPVYVISLVVTALVDHRLPKLSYGLASVFMVQAWNPFDQRMWGACNYVCWTLSVEAFFYLMFPWIQSAVERVKPGIQLVLLGSLLCLSVALNTSSFTQGHPSFGTVVALPFPILRLPEFAIGMLLGNMYLHSRQTSGRQLLLIRLSETWWWTYLACAGLLGLLCMAPGRLSSLVLLPFSMLLMGLALRQTLLARWLSTKLMLLGGGISYSIYLMQTATKDFSMQAADRLHIPSETFRVGLDAFLLLAVSLFLFKQFEEPSRRVIRSLFLRWENFRLSSRVLPMEQEVPTAGEA